MNVTDPDDSPFNSTLVRLKETTLKLIEKNTIFQFHFGTIKS